MDDDRLLWIVDSFRTGRTELEHVEFKKDWHSGEELAKDICAISNTILRRDLQRGYIIFGIDDKTHEFVNTDLNLKAVKVNKNGLMVKGNEELESWLKRSLFPHPKIEFRLIHTENCTVNVIIILPSDSEVMRFGNVEWIRIGTYTKSLNDFSEIKGDLWERIRSKNFENLFAKEDLLKEQISEY